MCGQSVQVEQSEAAGIINGLKIKNGISIADELADLDEEHFDAALDAFRQYRRSIQRFKQVVHGT